MKNSKKNKKLIKSLELESSVVLEKAFLFFLFSRKHDKYSEKILYDCFQESYNINDIRIQPSNMSLLHIACYRNDLKLLEDILKLGGDINAQKSDGSTALHIASKSGNKNILKVLYNYGVDINVVDNYGDNAIDLAEKNNDNDTVKDLICYSEYFNSKDNIYSFWNLAAYRGDINLVKFLFENFNLDVNETDYFQQTVAHWAVKSGQYNILKFLCENGVNVNAISYGYNLMHWAAQEGYIEIAEMLVNEYEVDFDSLDLNGKTPLVLAAEKGHLDILKLLVHHDAGTDIITTTVLGHTPLTIATAYGHLDVVKFLVEECNIDVNQTATNGYTPLMIAAQYGYYEIVATLINDLGADTEITEYYGKDYLALAEKNGHHQISELGVIPESSETLNC